MRGGRNKFGTFYKQDRAHRMRQMSNRSTTALANQNQQHPSQQRGAIITQTSTSLAAAPYYSNEQALAQQRFVSFHF